MNIYGVVSEFNPFHNGHEYLLNKINNFSKNNIIIVALSSSFVQRGEPGFLTKWQRTELALKGGANLVVELPFVFSCQNAEIFSLGAIGILNNLNITDLVFGSETDEIQKLINIAKVLLTNNPSYDKLLKEKLQSGTSFIVSRNESLLESGMLNSEDIEILSKPNNILGIEYIKSVLKINPNINIKNISRIGVQHDSNITLNKYSSASYIRNLPRNNPKLKNLVPSYTYKMIQKNKSPDLEKLLDLLKYKFLIDKDSMKNSLEYEVGVENRFDKYLYDVKSFNEIIDKVSNKRLTKSRIRRLVISYLLNVEKKDVFKALENNEYLRILGMDEEGMKYLRKLEKPYITNFKEIKNHNENVKFIGEIEVKTTNLYSIFTNNNINLDYKRSPIIKKWAFAHF